MQRGGVARNAAWAEDEGIVPPGMGRWAQVAQGFLAGFGGAGGFQEEEEEEWGEGEWDGDEATEGETEEDDEWDEGDEGLGTGFSPRRR